MPDSDGAGLKSAVPRSGIELVVIPSRVFIFLLEIIAVLATLSLAGQAMIHTVPSFPAGLADLFYVDHEQSLPTLYSSGVILLTALLVGAVAHAHRRAGRPYVRHWAALCLVLLCVAVDEFVSLHEKAVRPLRDLLDIETGPLWYAWVVPGAIAVGVFVVAFTRFLQHLPQPTRRGLCVAGAIFVVGALGVEMVGGWYASVRGQDTMVFALIATAEETLEMVGIAAAIYTLLAYLPVGLPDAEWRIRVRTTRA